MRIAAQKTARALTPNPPARRSSRRPRTLLVEALEARQLLDVGGFTAFNDLLAGPGTHANTTTYDANPASADAASGPLRRIDNGANTTATLTVSQSGSIAFGTTTDNPEPGTDAYEAFNGFVDFGNGGAQSIELFPNESYTYSFSGLDPIKRYDFTGTAIRSNNNYTDRWTLVTLVGADSFTPSHSGGVGVVTAGLPANQVAIWTGANHNPGQGFVAEWLDVDPGADGVFDIVSSQYRGPTPGVGTGDSSGGSKGYGIAGLRLIEKDVSLQVASITPADGEVVFPSPGSITVQFNKSVDPLSVQAGDLQIDGATASGFVIEAEDRIRFNVAGQLDVDQHTVTLAAGALTGDDGSPLAGFTSQFVVPGLPTIANLPPSDLGATFATFGADVQSTGGDNPVVTLYWGTSDGGTNPAAWQIATPLGAGGVGIVEHTAETLSPSTTYYYRARATNAAGTVWASPTASFITDVITLPAVALTGATDIGAFGATLRGVVTDAGGQPPNIIVYYGTQDAGTNELAWQESVLMGPQEGDFAAIVGDLAASTTYFYRVRAQNDAGIVWSGSSQSFSTLAPADLQISEFLADNDTGLSTRIRSTPGGNFGSILFPGWIEIYNPNADPVLLDGYYLTDRDDDLTRWAFPPGTSILAGGYLVVFASGEDITDPALDERGYLHTSFSLNNGGEYLGLTRDGGVIVDEYAPEYPNQSDDVSYGRGSDGELYFFPSPTPGAANTPIAQLNPVPPEYSVPSRTFTSNFQLALSTPEAGGTIYYTTNGATPTTGSAVYSSPITISDTRTVRAFVRRPDGRVSPVTSQTYIRLDNSVLNFSSDLPVVVIDTFGGSIGTGSRQLSFLGIIEPDEATGRTTLSGPLSVGTRSGIAIRGSSSSSFPKKNYRLEFWDEQNEDLDAEVLGMPGEADWILYGPDLYDRALINNPLIYDLSNQVGRYATRTRWVEVYLNTGGGTISSSDYVGLYAIVEEVKRGDDRVDVEPLTTGIGGPVEGGFIYKIDRGSPYVDPRPAEITSAQRNYVDSYINSFLSALNGSDFTDPQLGYRQYFDVDAAIDHNLLNMLAMNVDALRLSTYMFKTADGKLEFGPIWDFDRAFESTDGRDNNPQSWHGTGDGTDYFTYGWWNRLFQDPDFWQAYIDRWQELRQDEFSLTNLYATIDKHADMIQEASVRTYNRWSNSRFGDLDGEINHLKDWLTQRVQWVDSRFVAAAALSQAGGTVPAGTTVSINAPTGTIYYTLDGSDPRLSGGGISLAAMQYSGPITINENTKVVARAVEFTGSRDGAFNNRAWGGPAEAVFITDEPALRVAEIMYNPPPADPGAGELDVDNDEFEFIELLNIGNQTIDLGDVRFTSGVQFDFSTGDVATLLPGQRVVVVANRDAFLSRYGAGALIAGEFADDSQLDNSGEKVELEIAFEHEIQDFTYSDAWYDVTDGLGFSLVVADPLADRSVWDVAEGWRASSVFGGTPGTDDSGVVAGTVVISELLAHTDEALGDWVEFHNTTGEDINVGGWFLSDDESLLTKYQIAPGTMILAGDYLVLSQSEHFGNVADPGTSVPFAFSELGERAILSSRDPQSGGPGGYREVVSFGATEREVTLARYVNSAGYVDYVAPQSTTRGEANTPPLVPQVVINEILYNPAAGVDEFIELYNRGAQSVSLFDPLNPQNTWQFTDGIQFVFPPGVSIPAGGYVLVVPIDPATYRATYGIPALVQIFGPWTGALDNSGEKLELSQPSDPELDGTVPLTLVERVRYNDREPWTELADGNGPSLAREVQDQWGNEPAHWQPGTSGGTPGAANQFIDGTPPSVPGGLTAGLDGSGQLQLSWSPAVDAQSGIALYRVYRDGVLVGTSATTSFVDAAATFDLPHQWQVSAVNGDGLESGLGVVLQSTTISLQQGVLPDGSYSGMTDTEVNSQSPSQNFANDTTLRADLSIASGGEQEWTLLRWDLSGIGPGVSILGAAVTINVTNSSPNPYYLYEMNRPWVEDEANWNQYANGQPWQTPGGLGPQDRGSEILGVLNGTSTGQLTASLTPEGVQVLREWIAGTRPNYGFLLYNATNDDSMQFDSSEVTSTLNRPKLTLTSFVADTTLPTIDQVQFNSSLWSPEFRDSLAAAGLGEGGYTIPGGGDQLTAIPFSGIDQVRIRFSEDVNISQGDLSIFGINTLQYAIAGFSYDAATLTATWSLAAPLLADKLLLELSDQITDQGGNRIDGNWTDGVSTFPTGNGTTDTDDQFRLRINVLPGDATGDGQADRYDAGAIIAALGTADGSPRYSHQIDLLPDGRITLADLRQLLQMMPAVLPAGEPVGGGGGANQTVEDNPLDATSDVFSRIGSGPAAVASSLLPSTGSTAVVDAVFEGAEAPTPVPTASPLPASYAPRRHSDAASLSALDAFFGRLPRRRVLARSTNTPLE